MLDDDVPPSPTPIRGPQNGTEGRFIIQFFELLDKNAQTLLAPHNQDARQPIDIDRFPPPVIIDMFYGCAAVLKWRSIQCSDGMWPTSSHCDNLESPHKDGGVSDSDEYTANKAAAKAARAAARKERKAEAARPLAEAMDFLASLWLRHAPVRRQQSPSKTEQDRKQEQDRSRDKVSTWL